MEQSNLSHILSLHPGIQSTCQIVYTELQQNKIAHMHNSCAVLRQPVRSITKFLCVLLHFSFIFLLLDFLMADVHRVSVLLLHVHVLTFATLRVVRQTSRLTTKP